MSKLDKKVKIIKDMYLMERYYRKLYEKIDENNLMEYAILIVLYEKPLTIKQIAFLLSANHSLISQKITSMEKSGLIKKKVFKDNRYKLIDLDEKGYKVIHKFLRSLKLYGDNIFSKMTNKEIDQLDKLLAKFNFK